MMDALGKKGLSQVIAVDLTRREVGIPVVRIVVPGLEQSLDAGRLGPRARRASEGSEIYQ